MLLTNRELLSYSHLRDLNFKISIPPWKSCYFLFKLQTFRLPTVWRSERDFQFEIDIRILFVPTGKRNPAWCLWILCNIGPCQIRRNASCNAICIPPSFFPSFHPSFPLIPPLSFPSLTLFFCSPLPLPFFPKICSHFCVLEVFDSIIYSLHIH